MFKTKLKSFSVLEVTFSLLVTAIIIGIIYVLFDLLTYRLEKFKQENVVVTDFNRFSAVFSSDLSKNDVLRSDNEDICLNGFKNDSCIYIFNNDYITRTNHTFIDTFNIKIITIKLDTVSNGKKTNVFQRLTFDFDFDNEIKTVSYHKRLYPDVLLKEFKAN